MRRAAGNAAAALGAVAVVVALLLIPPGAQAEFGGSRDARNDVKPLIVKGTSASIAELPWLALIAYQGPTASFQCTGSVIAPRVILTAGHCVVSDAGRVLSPSNFRVVTGRADLKQIAAGDVSSVNMALVAPGFRLERLASDAALLVLDAPVAAPAIRMAGAGDGLLLSAGTPMLIAGWGLTSGDSARAPSVLRSGETVIQRPGYCRQKARRATPFFNASTQFCAIEAPKFEIGSCRGDSGGPGIALGSDGTPVQVGIISAGFPDCRTNIPEVLTQVEKLAPWASAWISALEAGTPAPAVVRSPLVRLPKMTFREARFLSYVVLAADFRNHFKQGRFKEIRCHRVDREKVQCEVFWYLARSVYIGTITTYYRLPQEGSVWDARYRIRKVGAGCWLRTGNPKRCAGTLFYR